MENGITEVDSFQNNNNNKYIIAYFDKPILHSNVVNARWFDVSIDSIGHSLYCLQRHHFSAKRSKSNDENGNHLQEIRRKVAYKHKCTEKSLNALNAMTKKKLIYSMQSINNFNFVFSLGALKTDHRLNRTHRRSVQSQTEHSHSRLDVPQSGFATKQLEIVYIYYFSWIE